MLLLCFTHLIKLPPSPLSGQGQKTSLFFLLECQTQIGSGGWTRTSDITVMSRAFYRLNYPAIFTAAFSISNSHGLIFPARIAAPTTSFICRCVRMSGHWLTADFEIPRASPSSFCELNKLIASCFVLMVIIL